jgi:hypothetical protein
VLVTKPLLLITLLVSVPWESLFGGFKFFFEFGTIRWFRPLFVRIFMLFPENLVAYYRIEQNNFTFSLNKNSPDLL